MGSPSSGELNQPFNFSEIGPGAAIVKRLHLIYQEQGANSARN